jgi:hypothetical protein
MHVRPRETVRNRESLEAFVESQACPLITWLLRVEAARHMNPNWVSQICLEKGTAEFD